MSTPDTLANLAARLTPADRESYAALISYRDSLPPGDEFARLMELVGLLSLLGQRIPDAAVELLTELRSQTKTAAAFHSQITERLAGLPGEIAKGVDAAEIVLTVSEGIRQQIEETALENTATLLRESAKEINALSFLISDEIKPVAQEYTSMAATISGELDKLTAASRQLQNQNAHLLGEQPLNSWIWQGMFIAVMFLMGCFCGIVFEKNQTAAALTRMSSQIDRIQVPAVAAVAPPPKKSAKR
jgi:uncharacterized phage infection (PIP) family protein YhgE